MDQFAANLIQTFGGTSAVARYLEAPTSTVHSWKQIGIPGSRLAHLKLVAQVEGIAVDWATGQKAQEPEAETVSEGDAESMPDSDTAAPLVQSSNNAGENIRGEAQAA